MNYCTDYLLCVLFFTKEYKPTVSNNLIKPAVKQNTRYAFVGFAVPTPRLQIITA